MDINNKNNIDINTKNYHKHYLRFLNGIENGMSYEGMEHYLLKDKVDIKEIKKIKSNVKKHFRKKTFKITILYFKKFIIFLLIIPGLIIILPLIILRSLYLTAGNEGKNIQYTKYSYNSRYSLRKIFTTIKNMKMCTSAIKNHNAQIITHENEYFKLAKIATIGIYLFLIVILIFSK